MSSKKYVGIYLTPEQHAKIKARTAELRKRSMGEYLWELAAQEMGLGQRGRDRKKEDPAG